jgi:hypothetical protein
MSDLGTVIRNTKLKHAFGTDADVRERLDDYVDVGEADQ